MAEPRDLTPSEISAQTGVPLATVKTRLQRGLGMLRERFDREGGEWRAAFGAVFGLERAMPVGAGAAVTTGVLLMGTGMKVAIGSVIGRIRSVYLAVTVASQRSKASRESATTGYLPFSTPVG